VKLEAIDVSVIVLNYTSLFTLSWQLENR